MSDTATIKVPRAVHTAVRDAARAAHVTQGELIEEMLRERRKAEFWAQLDVEAQTGTDQAYRDELAEADAATLPDTQDYIERFEAGE
jgi:hypothetical protein